MVAALAGCAFPDAQLIPTQGAYSALAAHETLTWKMFPAVGALEGIVRAPDGDYWAGDNDVLTLSRYTPQGKLTTYPVRYFPSEMAADRSGNLWFTNARYLNEIVRYDPLTRGIATFSLSDDAYGGVTLGRDGNVWFVENSHIGKITPDGLLTEFPTPMTQGASGLTFGRDGLVWFEASGTLGYVLASLNPLTGRVRLYDARVSSNAGSILSGPSESIWYVVTGRPDELVRFDSKSEKVTAYSAPRDFTASPCSSGMALSASGSIWYATQRLRGRGYDKRVIGGGYIRFDIKTKRFTAYASPKGYDWNCDLVMGRHGQVWSTAGPGVSVLYLH
jgi:streptogramin lyase